ncbi:MAG: GAF domain-containing protein [Mojavia pulchra JT2-VF2]|jgi:GAF domain-containing protein|uniref:GAF domain-containing protein n=1 Tax=Mojavia pulchra JT2-VF2 TaxID=287848 RepID=A0A951Q4W7_9NOST|nr:GAF domain-containing protein [Mojavia pulchra JT2-VF2]
MTNLVLHEAVQSILEKNSDPDAIFTAILPVVGEVLQCDRCFLYLRNPQTKFGQIGYCWRRNQDIPDMREPEWKLEPAWLPQVDPLFAAALQTAPSIYVEDVETASPEVLNKDFEREHFGHRALIHAHLCQDQQLWGILQPCVFGQQRTWSESDRTFITQLENKLAPLAVAYVKGATDYSS